MSFGMFDLYRTAWRNRALLGSLVKRDIYGRYKGSLFGFFWVLFTPVFMLCVYTFVFSVVFNARWGGGGDSKTEFALVLFAGLIVFNVFSECVNRAPTLIMENVNYVKKVVFPIEVLPLVVLMSAGFNMLVSLGVWLLAYTFLYGVPHETVLLLPALVVPLFLMILGISLALSALGVYIRDISQLIGMITTVLLFLSPIFYPVSALPEKFQVIILMNPLTSIIEEMRNLLYWGEVFDVDVVLIYWVVSLAVSFFGFYLFMKMRKGFADVL